MDQMKGSVITRIGLVALLALPGLTPAGDSPDTTSSELHAQLAQLDKELFENAFVVCDAAKFRRFFTEDAEFYHDKAGPTFGKDVWTLKGCPGNDGVQRILVPESLEVYPMNNYGAIQTGEHWFVEEGATTSTLAKFVHLWRFEDGEWRIARVLSFDHQSKPKSEGPQG